MDNKSDKSSVNVLGGQLAFGGGAHGQAILERCGLRRADGGGCREAPSQGTGGRQTSAVSQALGKVQS